VVEQASITRAAELCFLSQPAVTQAIAKLERKLGLALFQRSAQGLFVSTAGELLAGRVRRAFDLLDRAMQDLAPRLKLTATTAQLRALAAVRDAENFTLAARELGIAQPTVHRAVGELEKEAGRPLLDRTAYGMIANRYGEALADAARLAFAELVQADMELAEAGGRESGRITIGALPLSRSHLLPAAIAAFRQTRPHLAIRVLDGPYADLLTGLRRGDIDFLIGALREPAPIGDVVQQALFSDSLVIIARPGHPILKQHPVRLEDLAACPWVVGPRGIPARNIFDRLFEPLGEGGPKSIVESGSLMLMRQVLLASDHLGFISRLQAAAETRHGLVVEVPFAMPDTSRPIGITTRRDWLPTAAQKAFLDLLGA
jgi:DNA-binding transcriptional LysR family regulator